MIFEMATGSARQALERADHLLDRIEESGRTEALLAARLAEDMNDCTGQIGSVMSFALRSTFPLTGRDCPRREPAVDLPGLRSGVDAATDLIVALVPADFDGAPARMIRHRAGEAELIQPGGEYLARFALPNLWFHLSVAFAILRADGLDIGKIDYDGWHAYGGGGRG